MDAGAVIGLIFGIITILLMIITIYIMMKPYCHDESLPSTARSLEPGIDLERGSTTDTHVAQPNLKG